MFMDYSVMNITLVNGLFSITFLFTLKIFFLGWIGYENVLDTSMNRDMNMTLKIVKRIIIKILWFSI